MSPDGIDERSHKKYFIIISIEIIRILNEISTNLRKYSRRLAYDNFLFHVSMINILKAFRIYYFYSMAIKIVRFD